ncbi:HD domain-containing phosphohydrolase [Halopseudomonas salegens]|uniref:Cache domain-containing protein n=1 Tax=Halopseudomonas salegens TaxID=1434072 RepID=A0A1H2GB58_9GAMM|nr:HD domain-containing phosphohydrolase [Halopseudomonas salegens]SDU16618.1 Cache domain-containing protein [Halopseudomonas salegens]
MRNSGLPVQWMLAGGIVLSLLAVMLVTVVQGYRGTSAAMLAAAEDSARQLAVIMDERAGRLISPAENTLHALAHDPLGAATDIEQRLERLPLLVEVLTANSTLSAVFIGYANGEFLLVRPLQGRNPALAQAPPEQAAYLVQSMHYGDDQQLRGHWQFYDAELTVLPGQAEAEYRFDPRTRPWYQQARETGELLLTEPYVFFTTGEVGLTMALPSKVGDAVIGLDAALGDLASELHDMRMTPGSEVAVVDADGRVLAYPDLEQILKQQNGSFRLAGLSELTNPALHTLSGQVALRADQSEPVSYVSDNATWYGISLPLAAFADSGVHVLIAIPGWELLAGARDILLDQAIWALAIMLVILPLGWKFGRRLGEPLSELAEQVRAFSDFDFTQPPRVRSRIREVNHLSVLMGRMGSAIDHFQQITLALSHEPHLEQMLDEVMEHLVATAEGRSGAVYLCNETDTRLNCSSRYQGAHYPDTFVLDEAFRNAPEEQLLHRLDADHSYLVVALHDRHKALLGLLVVELSVQLEGDFRQRLQRFVQDLSGTLSVAIETRILFAGQQRLLDAMIRLLADAIDAKSPYTGGHCERVPQLAKMLLSKAEAAREGALADFNMNEDQHYEFHLASWLHDCGKITSPEYVVDKATKLETIYNRIHEIRTRFEVLWRDAELDCLRAQLSGGDGEQLRQDCRAVQQQLQEEFALVAKANIGGEAMSDEQVAELEQIAQRRWLRHFDNRLGLSLAEQARMAEIPTQDLPVSEGLLADRPEHIFPWGDKKPPVERDNPANHWGFDMALPEHAMHLGELYNLRISRGTLTPEERFKINDHIVQTLIMLESLPFPRYLQRVPTLAATHHETLDGRGYPRRLTAEQLGVPERIMAIADIFEALTAADRPYKEAKTLSVSLGILVSMAEQQHVDADLLHLFIAGGVYRQYAEQFLQPEQCDTVDEAGLLARLEALISG